MEKTSLCKATILVFASGTRDGGGSGFEKLIESARNNSLEADIAAVVSSWQSGGVQKRAERLGIPFEYMSKPYTLEKYQCLLKKYNAQWIVLSGWLKLVPMSDFTTNREGLDPRKTINIHPGPLPRFGGSGMYGGYVHQAVYEAFKNGEITETGPTIHFVTAEYDKGPIIFHRSFPIQSTDNVDTIAKKVQELEQLYHPMIVNLVVNGKISWDGINKSSLSFPKNYEFFS